MIKLLDIIALFTCIGIFFYCLYVVITFVPVYHGECNDDLGNRINITTTNKTEYTIFYNECLRVIEDQRKLNNPGLIIPDLNFSQLLNNT